MFDTLQPILLGAATVFDMVLLLSVLERRNWPFVRLPIVAMLAGAWLWHGGLFAQSLLGDWPVIWLCYLQGATLIAMLAGLLLMPCGLLHATWRIAQTGLDILPRPLLRHGLAYAPMLALAPLALQAARSPGRDLITLTAGPVAWSYLLFSSAVDLVACGVLLRERRRTCVPASRNFLLALALGLMAIMIAKAVYLIANPASADARGWSFLALAFAPLVPAFLFAYYVIRHRFLQIFVEQSIAYGAILGGILLFHQLAFQGLSAIVPESYRFSLVLVETCALAALILAYRPLRERVAEALRYLVGARVSGIRERLQILSRDLSLHAGEQPRPLLTWFAPRLQMALRVEFVSCWLKSDAGEILVHAGDNSFWPEGRARRLYQRMLATGELLCSRRLTSSREIVEELHEGRAALAIGKTRAQVAGLLIIGKARPYRDLSDEETTAVSLLIEQLAITLENGILHGERLAAERRAMLHEKLSTLGLMAGAIAHEIKNPLSAIKTIATVMAEDLGEESAHAEDLRLILSEVDRLAKTTAQLLALVRPKSVSAARGSLHDVLSGALRLLRHLASERGVRMEATLPEMLPSVRGDEQLLWEIFFNLLSNSVEAAGSGGKVTLRSYCRDGAVVTEVGDDGPGLPAEVRARLFEPFLTTKESGTGLGLFVVGRRVAEIGGTIECQSAPNQGTLFTVEIPHHDPANPHRG